MHIQCIKRHLAERNPGCIMSAVPWDKRVIVMRMILTERMPARAAGVAVLPGILSAVGAAQGGARADSSRRAAEDSARVQRLADVRVSVTRAPASEQRLPWAVGVQGKEELTRGQGTLGIDEA